MLAGDVTLAENTFAAFFGLWERFGLLPERFTLDAGPHGSIHPTEQYYPLRPELMESAFYLHQVCVLPSMHACIHSSCDSLLLCSSTHCRHCELEG